MIAFFTSLYESFHDNAPRIFGVAMTVIVSLGALAVVFLGILGLTKGGDAETWTDGLLAKRGDLTVHRLKVHPGPFKALLDRVKRFEFRRDDRNYKVGDVLHLAEFDPAKEGGDYTGRVVLRRVTYKLPGGTFGVPEGFCVLSIEEYP